MNHADYKIRNLESQILYLQQEHASTLKLLHNEIKDLQMKNSESSFQLAMINFTGIDADNSKTALDNTETQVEQLKAEIASLNTQLLSKIERLEQFELQIHHLSDTVAKLKEVNKAEIRKMELELTKKSAAIAHLSTRLLSLKKAEQAKEEAPLPNDARLCDPRTSFTVQSPITPKIFKIRNQISVHPDNTHSRRRPIVAQHCLVSNSMPTKERVMFPEYAVSVEDRAVFSKSIRRPSVLPPITPTKTRSSHQHRQTSPRSPSEELAAIVDMDTNVSPPPSDSEVVHIDVDRLIAIGNSSRMSAPQSVKWSVTKTSPS